jgi:hypothetical protein
MLHSSNRSVCIALVRSTKLCLLAVVGMTALGILACTQHRSVDPTPPDTSTDYISPSRYFYVDPHRTFSVWSSRTDSDHLCEPILLEEKIIGEQYTDVNNNGHYDEGIDAFVVSNDLADNQDLNHNGHHDGPENMTCNTWEAEIPFDDIDGNGTPRCEADVRCPSNYDSLLRKLPFLDINDNGSWDSISSDGWARGKWQTDSLGGIVFNGDSSCKYTSDSGLIYYVAGNRVCPGLSFQLVGDTLYVKTPAYSLAMPTTEPLATPFNCDDSIAVEWEGQSTKVAYNLQIGAFDATQFVDSVYHHIVVVNFYQINAAPRSVVEGCSFCFGRDRGLLQLDIIYGDGRKELITAANSASPVIMTKPNQ